MYTGFHCRLVSVRQSKEQVGSTAGDGCTSAGAAVKTTPVEHDEQRAAPASAAFAAASAGPSPPIVSPASTSVWTSQDIADQNAGLLAVPPANDLGQGQGRLSLASVGNESSFFFAAGFGKDAAHRLCSTPSSDEVRPAVQPRPALSGPPPTLDLSDDDPSGQRSLPGDGPRDQRLQAGDGPRGQRLQPDDDLRRQRLHPGNDLRGQRLQPGGDDFRGQRSQSGDDPRGQGSPPALSRRRSVGCVQMPQLTPIMEEERDTIQDVAVGGGAEMDDEEVFTVTDSYLEHARRGVAGSQAAAAADVLDLTFVSSIASAELTPLSPSGAGSGSSAEVTGSGHGGSAGSRDRARPDAGLSATGTGPGVDDSAQEEPAAAKERTSSYSAVYGDYRCAESSASSADVVAESDWTMDRAQSAVSALSLPGLPVLLLSLSQIKIKSNLVGSISSNVAHKNNKRV